MKPGSVSILVCILVAVCSAVPIQAITTTTPKNVISILYVGGSGPGNYTTIQDAVNDSSDGDTVFVYAESAPYHEEIIINHSIVLCGENRETTIINGSGFFQILSLQAPAVWIHDLTIENPEIDGIEIGGNFTKISQTTIRNCTSAGITITTDSLFGVLEQLQIYDNRITGCGVGIVAFRINHSTIMGNILEDNWDGTLIGDSFNNLIIGNIVIGNECGFDDDFCGNNTYRGNIIQNNTYGIDICASDANLVEQNEFYDNIIHATFEKLPGYELRVKRQAFFEHDTYFFQNYHVFGSTTWDKNYWDEPLSHPYIIRGSTEFWSRLVEVTIHRFEFDRNPATAPYNQSAL